MPQLELVLWRQPHWRHAHSAAIRIDESCRFITCLLRLTVPGLGATHRNYSPICSYCSLQEVPAALKWQTVCRVVGSETVLQVHIGPII